MAADFTDLLWADGQDCIGGTQTMHYYAPLSWIANLPVASATPATLTDKVIINNPITFHLGKKFLKMYSTMDTGRVFDKQVGEIDGKSFESSFEWFFPGTKAEALALIALMNNSNMFFLALEANGQRRMMGSRAFPAKLELADVDTGTKTSDRKGTKLRVSSRGVIPAAIYDPSQPIQLTPSASEPADPDTEA